MSPHAHLNLLRSIPESASGIGANKILPPKQDEPQIDTERKPPDSDCGPDTLILHLWRANGKKSGVLSAPGLAASISSGQGRCFAAVRASEGFG